jgi:phosphoglycolate phosphatase-like HAD superfamily hydrolase
MGGEKSPALDHVILDWNGTLLADAVASWEAANLSLAAFNGRPVTLAAYRDTLDIPIIEFYVRHGCDRRQIEEKREQLERIYHENYERLVARARTRRGARQLLTWLGRHGVQRVILSNHTVRGIGLQLSRLRLRNHIDQLLANEAPGVVLMRSNKLEKLTTYLVGHSGRQRVAIIGDGPEEVEIGRSAGIWTVAISDGTFSKRRLRAARPDFLVDSLPEAIVALGHVTG